MANSEQLKQILAGARHWNLWREKHKDVQIDLSGADLRDVDFEEETFVVFNPNFTGANLKGANLSGIEFTGALFDRANLSGANLNRAKFMVSSFSRADLTGASLKEAKFSAVDFSEANFNRSDLSEVVFDTMTALNKANLNKVNLRKADLREVELNEANLSGADLSQANLTSTELVGVHLRSAILTKANLSRANFTGANLSEANLVKANLNEADLSEANLSRANFTDANLSEANLVKANLAEAVLTGSCIQDWNVSPVTNTQRVRVDFIYLRCLFNETDNAFDYLERRPEYGIFRSSEFSNLIQQAIDTIDILFEDGIDWSAFLQAFRDIRAQNADQDISIKAIESRGKGTFVIRLEVSHQSNKTAIKEGLEELYEFKLSLIERHYKDVLELKDGQIADYRQQNTDLTRFIEERPPFMTSITNQTFKASVGNVSASNYGTMIAHLGVDVEGIVQLVHDMQRMSKSFPNEQRESAEGHLEDLVNDLRQSTEPSQSALKRRIVGLLSIAIAIAGSVATATDFTNNVLQLSDRLNVPATVLKPQIQEFKQLRPDFDWPEI